MNSVYSHNCTYKRFKHKSVIHQYFLTWISGLHSIYAPFTKTCCSHFQSPPSYPLFSFFFFIHFSLVQPLPVRFKAFPKPQHQFTFPHPSLSIVTEDLVPPSWWIIIIRTCFGPVCYLQFVTMTGSSHGFCCCCFTLATLPNATK